MKKKTQQTTDNTQFSIKNYWSKRLHASDRLHTTFMTCTVHLDMFTAQKTLRRRLNMRCIDLVSFNALIKRIVVTEFQSATHHIQRLNLKLNRFQTKWKNLWHFTKNTFETVFQECDSILRQFFMLNRIFAAIRNSLRFKHKRPIDLHITKKTKLILWFDDQIANWSRKDFDFTTFRFSSDAIFIFDFAIFYRSNYLELELFRGKFEFHIRSLFRREYFIFAAFFVFKEISLNSSLSEKRSKPTFSHHFVENSSNFV